MLLKKDEIFSRAKKKNAEGENWHKKVNVREMVFSSNDGSISTLALLAGVTGGALARSQILVAGFSGVITGAISMAIGAYIYSISEIEHLQSEIKREEQETEDVPEVEREEIHQIYVRKADFAEDGLDMIVGCITSDKRIWLDSMMKEELGLFAERFENSVKVGLITLVASVARRAGANTTIQSSGYTSNRSFDIIDSDICFSFRYGLVENSFYEQTLASIRSGNGFCRNSCYGHPLSDWRHSASDNALSDGEVDH